MQKANVDIRQAAQAAGIKLWQVADALYLCDSTFSRKLRRELSPEEKARIREIIAHLVKEREANA